MTREISHERSFFLDVEIMEGVDRKGWTGREGRTEKNEGVFLVPFTLIPMTTKLPVRLWTVTKGPLTSHETVKIYLSSPTLVLVSHLGLIPDYRLFRT